MDIGLERLARFLEDARASGVGKEAYRHAWGPPMGNGDRARIVPAFHRSLSVGDCLDIYRTMVLSRQLDHRELTLQKQGHAWFSISGAGREAVMAAAGKALRPADPILAYYRDRALCLMRGITPRDMLLQAAASRDDPASSGRQMPAHWADLRKAVIVPASPVGVNCIPAVGLAEAISKTEKLLANRGTYPSDAVVYASLGDGTTAEGEVYEALRAAILSRAPVIFHLEDDGWGISVPVSEQVPGGDVMALFRGWPGLRCMEVDGLGVRESYDAFVDAAAWCRARNGPVLLRSRVLRLMSHSSTDDMRKYRPAVDIAIDFERDPIPRFAGELVAWGVADPDELLKLNRDVEAEVAALAEEVVKRPKTDPREITTHVFRWKESSAKARYEMATRGRRAPAAGRTLPLADALNAVLDELMEVQPQLVIWGEDVADLSRDNLERHPELKGKGGVFGITYGLQRKYGADRVSNSPIAEATIIGRAVGHSIQGFLPVVEVQFRDYLNPAWQQLVDEAATMSWRSAGRFACPMVIRMAYGGYLGGAGAVWHSESANGPLLHYPGLRLCVPSNARDAVALMRAAVFSGEIVLFMEPKSRYRRPCAYAPPEYPGFEEVLWPGTSRTYGDGRDIAILTYGTTVPLAWDALAALEKDGIRGRMVDLPWLSPLDEDAIRTAADACGRVLVLDEDRRTCGAGAAIADVIYRDRSLRRRVDVVRLAAKDCRVSYGPVGERAVLPQTDDIVEAVSSMLTP